MIKLISFKNCPFVQRVMGAIVTKNVPFEIEYIELNAVSRAVSSKFIIIVGWRGFATYPTYVKR